MSTVKLLPELVRPIFSRVFSLASLDRLLRASPAASLQFNAFPSSIFEYVLSSTRIHEHTCALIRIVALVRDSALPPYVRDTLTLTDFIRQETTSYRYWPPTWTYPATRLSSGMQPLISASTLLSILDTQREIEAQVAGCLKFYLERFNALRPCHLVDPEFPSKSADDGNGVLIDSLPVHGSSRRHKSLSPYTISARRPGSKSNVFSELSGAYSSFATWRRQLPMARSLISAPN